MFFDKNDEYLFVCFYEKGFYKCCIMQINSIIRKNLFNSIVSHKNFKGRVFLGNLHEIFYKIKCLYNIDVYHSIISTGVFRIK